MGSDPHTLLIIKTLLTFQLLHQNGPLFHLGSNGVMTN